MFRVRKVADTRAPVDRRAVEEVQDIIRAQFAGMTAADIDKLPDQLQDPLKYRFVSELLVAQDASDRVKAFALLLYAPDHRFCYLEMISAAPGRTGGGLGDVLYSQVREEAGLLGANLLVFECLPDDPALSPDPKIRKQNADRLRFYERYGARPLARTKYETPLRPDEADPPYLVIDKLDSPRLPTVTEMRGIVRAVLERKYGDLCPPSYVDMVVASVKAVRLRSPRHAEQEMARSETQRSRIVLVVNDKHDIHHVRDRGYVEAPVRIKSILAELEATTLFTQVRPRHYADRHIRAAHDSALVDYIERACARVGQDESLYPYVFPIRNAARPPKELAVRAGYYCIDTFTPLNANAYKAARGAVDCALTAAAALLDGKQMAYALVRPPGHHAERRVFGGFCYFNNAAIAAHYLSHRGRVAVLDIDYHHGNGIQDIFLARSDVLTVSIHGHPRFAYPYFSGFKEETGIGPGAGYNVNIPLPETVTPERYLEALRTAVRRIARFRPDFLVLAVGFDTAKSDPTGTWLNRAADFEAIGRVIGGQGYPTVIVQEGGYRVRTLGVNARRFFTGLADAGATARRRKIGPAISELVPSPEIEWRDSVRAPDIESVRSLVASTAFFNTEEIATAAELVRERLAKGEASGYEFIFAEAAGQPLGYACFGPIAGTNQRFDLYWIAVHPDRRRSGLGRQLLARVEAAIRSHGGRRIFVDTAGRDLYEPTRAFYAACGYRKLAEVKDFFADGDAKIIFAKDLSS